MDEEAIARELLAQIMSNVKATSTGAIQVNTEAVARIVAALDRYTATLSPAEPSPESREDFYANLYARSCGDVLRVRAETIEECAKVAEEYRGPPPLRHAGTCRGIASAIRTLSAPAHD
jgi:hypothetical protein